MLIYFIYYYNDFSWSLITVYFYSKIDNFNRYVFLLTVFLNTTSDVIWMLKIGFYKCKNPENIFYESNALTSENAPNNAKLSCLYISLYFYTL